MKVIAIPDNETLLVSYDDYDQIKKGLYVSVYIKGPKQIIINGENFGTYDYIKETLEITYIFDKFFECRKILNNLSKKVSLSISALQSLNYAESVSLDVDINEIDESLKIANPDSTIKIGDLVKLA